MFSRLGLVVALLLSSAGARADVEISSKPTSNMSCDAGVCTATAQKAVLNVTDLANMLVAGDVTVKTGLVAKDIDIDQPLTWTSTSRLTLDAQRSITVKKALSVTGTGALTITTDDGGSDGDLLFENKGSVTFWDTGSSLVINGQSYVLVKDIATLAADIAANPAGFYALAADYDASVDGTYTDSPIPTTLQGTFEGLGHTISNLTIATQGVLNTGFFAQVGSAGAVRDFALRHASVSSQTSPYAALIGALAAESDGAIDAASVTGSVFGGQSNALAAGGLVGVDKGSIMHVSTSVRLKTSATFAGGIAGFVDGTARAAQIIQSIATGDVIGHNDSHSIVGGLAGHNNHGAIQRSRASGMITGSGIAAVGGLIGINEGSIDQSFATGAVRSGTPNHKGCYSNAGGLVGWNDSAITNSYATGSADGGADACMGGLVGADTRLSTVSYATGHVSGGTGAFVGGFAGKYYGKSAEASNCYWDTETSGTSDASGNKANVKGVKGLTTQELQSGLPPGFDPKIWAEDPTINGGFPYLLANPPKSP